MMRVCNKCKQEKHIDCFGVRKRSKDGISYVCKECELIS